MSLTGAPGRELQSTLTGQTLAMRLHEFNDEGIEVLRVEGDVDMHFSPVLRSVLKGKAKCRCRALVLDLAGVAFIDSTGLAGIIEYLRESATFGGEFCVTGLNEHVRSVFEIVRLDKALPIFTDSKTARDALAKHCVPIPPERLFIPSAPPDPGGRSDQPGVSKGKM
ncbi:MAG: STAS domain-containing protein [Chthoniobacterales bacterium]